MTTAVGSGTADPGSFNPAVSGAKLILAVDDDPAVLDLVGRFLAEEGYRVVGARSGAEGLKLAAGLKPYAITLDVFLPDRSGLEVLRVLKSTPATSSIPVLILSVADMWDEGGGLGGWDMLRKPVDRETLVAKLRELERRAETAQDSLSSDSSSRLI